MPRSAGVVQPTNEQQTRLARYGCSVHMLLLLYECAFLGRIFDRQLTCQLELFSGSRFKWADHIAREKINSTESRPRIVFLTHEGRQDGIEILIDQLGPVAVARAFFGKLINSHKFYFNT